MINKMIENLKKSFFAGNKQNSADTFVGFIPYHTQSGKGRLRKYAQRAGLV